MPASGSFLPNSSSKISSHKPAQVPGLAWAESIPAPKGHSTVQAGNVLWALMWHQGVELPLVALNVSGSKLLHQPVDLLGLAGQTETLQEYPQGRDKVFATEIQLIHVGIHHFLVKLAAFPKEFPYLSLKNTRDSYYCAIRVPALQEGFQAKIAQLSSQSWHPTEHRAGHGGVERDGGTRYSPSVCIFLLSSLPKARSALLQRQGKLHCAQLHMQQRMLCHCSTWFCFAGTELLAGDTALSPSSPRDRQMHIPLTGNPPARHCNTALH